MTVWKALLAGFILIPFGPARAQQVVESQHPAANGSVATKSASDTAPDSETGSERWNLFYQATSIGQYHGTFRSPYAGPNSLQDYPERDVSLTTTLFFGLRLDKNTQLYFDPEIAGGKGLSEVTGIANFPNGEMPRVASATPMPYIARLYVTHDFGFGSEKEASTSDENRLAVERPMTRYTVVVGRFTVTDFFDNNRCTHDPNAIHGLGHHVQRRLGLSSRYARLHLGMGTRVPRAAVVPPLCQCGPTKNRQWHTIRPQTIP